MLKQWYIISVLVSVLQRNRINKIDRWIDRFIIGIGLRRYGGQKVPRSAICKLETQESWRNNSVHVQRPENWRGNGVSPHLSLKA